MSESVVDIEDRFPRRARIVLVILAVVQVIGFLFIAIVPDFLSVQTLLLIWLGGGVAFDFWLYNGLGSGAAWARPVAILTLWLVAFVGIVDTIVALGQNRINIPIGTLLALYALAAPAGPFRLPTEPEERQRAQLGCILAVVLFVAPPVLTLLAARG